MKREPTAARILPIAISAWAAVLLLGILVIQAGEAVVSRFNPDELQYLHLAWMLNHGYLPFRDFWANHPPLFIYLLKPLVAAYDEDASTLFLVARLVIWVINLGLLGLVAGLAVRKRSWSAGLFAALLLSINRTVFETMAQVRHDSLTLVCELFALVLLARGIESRRSRDVLAAGAALGCALTLSPKALFGISGLILGYVVYLVSLPAKMPRSRDLLYPIALLLAGTVGTFGLVTAALLPFDVWPLMVNRVFLESLNNPDRFSPITLYLLADIAAEPAIWVVMLGGIGVAARQWWLGSVRDIRETFLLGGGCGSVRRISLSCRLLTASRRSRLLPFSASLAAAGSLRVWTTSLESRPGYSEPPARPR